MPCPPFTLPPSHPPFSPTSNDPPVILLHGFPDTPTSFEPLVKILTKKYNYTCHTPYLPGYDPKLQGSYKVTDFDLVEIVGRLKEFVDCVVEGGGGRVGMCSFQSISCRRRCI